MPCRVIWHRLARQKGTRTQNVQLVPGQQICDALPATTPKSTLVCVMKPFYKRLLARQRGTTRTVYGFVVVYS
eukprot:4776196-Pleurochrysis_carterae.AAC.1